MTIPFSYKISALVGALLASLYLVVGIFQSTNSTAGIGFLFLPIFAAAGALAGGILFFVGETFFLFFSQRRHVSLPRSASAFLIFLSSALCLYFWQAETKLLQEAENPQASPPVLEQVYHSHYFFRGSAAIAAVAKNPSTPAYILEQMARGSQEELQGFVASNPSLSAKALEELVELPPSYFRLAWAVKNPKLSQKSVEYLLKLEPKDFHTKTDYHLYETYVLATLMAREDIPRPLFDAVAARTPQGFFLVNAILNSPKSTCAQIEKYLNHENAVLAGTAARRMEACKAH